MKIPNKIKIGSHIFDVHFTHNLDGFAIMGEGQHWKNRIIIQTDMVPSKQESTVFHEALHEMSVQQGWGLKEEQVTAISENFYAFLKDNDLLKGQEDERN